MADSAVYIMYTSAHASKEDIAVVFMEYNFFHPFSSPLLL